MTAHAARRSAAELKGSRFQLVPIALLAFIPFFGQAAESASPFDEQTLKRSPCQAIETFAADRAAGKPEARARNRRLDLNFPCELPQLESLNFLIASVPNPIGTHLQLWFDRSVESIQNAAGFVGLRFQSAWIPWDLDLVRETTDITQKELQRQLRALREREPGVLLFRAPAECTTSPGLNAGLPCRDLVVLLVPENPTGGLAQDVFIDAAKIALSASGSSDLRIPFLGPSFSGSFSSLGKIMAQSFELEGKSQTLSSKLRVISGTAASESAWKEAFTEASGSSYNTTVHTIDQQLLMLSAHMSGEWGKHGNIALLTESETGLGWHFATSNPGKSPQTIYRFPREISRLRSAYGDQELKAVVGSQQQSVSFRKLIGFKLFDVGPSADSTPVMATNQTPLSQDVILEDIARALERDHIDLAGIVATDIFDALFVVRYLRDACPNVRLFTFDSDLLYERAAEDFPFDGTMALSTYPLMPSNQTWTNLRRTSIGRDRGSIKERIFFPSRGAEGIYNAMRVLLDQSGYVLNRLKGAPLAEYFNPSLTSCPNAEILGCARPPMWLTVITRSGYWPVALQSAEDPLSSDPKNGQMISWPDPKSHPEFGLSSAPRVWLLLTMVFTVSIGWYFVSQFIACCTPYGERRGFTHLNLWPDEQGWQARLCYLLVRSASLLAFYWLDILPLIAISRYRDGSGLLVAPYLILFFLFVLLTCSPYLRFRKRVQRHGLRAAGWPDTWHYFILGLSAIFVTLFAIQAAQLFPLVLNPLDPRSVHQEAFFTAYRALHIDSGVSPVVPLLALLAAYFIWGRTHLKRITMRYEQLTSLPVLGSGPEFDALAKCRTRMERFVNEPLPLHWRTLGSFLLAVAIFAWLVRPLESFEPAAFDRSVLLLLSVLYALLFLTWSRFLLIWKEFHSFLEQLNRHPVRFVFSDLPSPKWISPLLQVSGRRRYLGLVALRDSLRLLATSAANELTAEIVRFEREGGLILAKDMDATVVRLSGATGLLDALGQINAAVVEELNQGPWREGHSSRIGADDSKNGTKDAREEIIAIQFHDYIQYIVHQQQNLLVFVISAFLLSMLALHSYPFQSPRILTTFISVMFLMFGAGVITVLAEAERDPVLSRITKTPPNELSSGFYWKVAGYLGVPLITVLGSQFPSWGRFLFSWVEPALEAMK